MANSNPHFGDTNVCEECGENLANVDSDSCQRCRNLHTENGPSRQRQLDAQTDRRSDNGWTPPS
jgi:hypothetical protein